MKLIIQSTFMACAVLMCGFLASCTDDALIEASNNPKGDQPFTLTVNQGDTRLALDPTYGLSTVWEPGDQLVLVSKNTTLAPIYLSCTLTENANEATFRSESGVPAGEYYVIYNYNENMAYGHKMFQSIDQINTDDDLVLWENLTVANNQYSASIQLKHLYAKIKVELENIPQFADPMMSYLKVGIYSSKKGFPMYKLFTSAGPIDAEHGINPNSLNYSSTNTYFASNRKYHNILLGNYSAESSWDNTNMTNVYDYSKAKALSALVLPADLTNEDVFFYVLSDNTCYEFKKEGGINFQAGTNYTIKLDFNSTNVVTSTLNIDDSGYILNDDADWRHAAYRNSYEYGYKISQDIDFKDKPFFPIVARELNGGNNTLSNIELDWSDEDNVGLVRFEWLYDFYNNIQLIGEYYYCKVSDLVLESVSIKGNNYVGAFGGNNVFVNNCKVIGESSIVGQGDYVGGIVGCNILTNNENMTFMNAQVGQQCTINGKNYVGGIVGRYMSSYMNSGISLWSSRVLLESCTSKAIVTATGDYVGGIFGKIGGTYTNPNSTLSLMNSSDPYTFSLVKCKNEGDVTGVNYVGGIGGDFAIYYWDTSVTDRIVLKESFSSGNVTGSTKVGGILGGSMASVNTCYSIGTINASTTDVGGILGSSTYNYMDGGNMRIANCYSLATLSAGTNGHVGGILGAAGFVTVINCYYAADPTTNSFGGIWGRSMGRCSITNCLTTLNSLGNVLTIPQAPAGTPDNDGDGVPDYDYNGDGVYDYNDIYLYSSHDVITNSTPSVTSILNKIDVINGDQAYSTNTWPTSDYAWYCVKFADFAIDTDSPDMDNDTVTP